MSLNIGERFYNWLTSWRISFGRKNSTQNSSTTSNCSNFSCGSTVSALKDSTKLTRSNVRKVVRFAQENGKVVAQVINNHDRDKAVKVVRSFEESIEEVFIKEGVITGFIKVKNLEPGRQVLVRYTEDNWKGFKQVNPRRVERIIDSKGRKQIKTVKEKNGLLSRRRKQVNPSVNSTIVNQEMTYLFKFEVEQTELHQVELVVISSLNNVIDTNHQQCYLFKRSRRSWEANGTPKPSPKDIYNNSN